MKVEVGDYARFRVVSDDADEIYMGWGKVTKVLSFEMCYLSSVVVFNCIGGRASKQRFKEYWMLGDTLTVYNKEILKVITPPIDRWSCEILSNKILETLEEMVVKEAIDLIAIDWETVDDPLQQET